VERREFSATIELNCKIPSENYIYKQGTVGRKKWYYLSPSVKAYKDELKRKLELTELAQLREIAGTVNWLEIYLGYVIHDHFSNRDVTNMTKATEDTISEVTGIDDSKHIKVVSEKILGGLRCRETVIVAIALVN